MKANRVFKVVRSERTYPAKPGTPKTTAEQEARIAIHEARIAAELSRLESEHSVVATLPPCTVQRLCVCCGTSFKATVGPKGARVTCGPKCQARCAALQSAAARRDK